MAVEHSVLQGLAELLESHPIVLFMRGQMRFPICMHSTAAYRLLRSYGLAFEALDVGEDAASCAALAELSGTTELPQVFVGGQFLAGFDLLVDLHQDGKLEALLEAASAEGSGTATGLGGADGQGTDLRQELVRVLP